MAVQLCLGGVRPQRWYSAICDVIRALSDLCSTCHVRQSAIRHRRLGEMDVLIPLSECWQ